MDKPYGVPPDFAEHFKLMTDMITIAFQADLTRVLTFLMTREGTSRSYREIGIADGHHPCTHHQGKPDLMEKVIADQRVPHEAARRVAREAEGDQGRRRQPARQLDDRLRRRACPTATATSTKICRRCSSAAAATTSSRGRRVIYRKETPMSNFHLTLMDRMGVPMEHFGDASGHARSGEPHVGRCRPTCSNPPGAARFARRLASPSTATSATASTPCWRSRCSTG